jgi:hypothetical protein
VLRACIVIRTHSISVAASVRAELPAASDLPEALRPLANRQAVTLRDATWHHDVDGLIRRLEGEKLIDAPRRRWRVVAAAAGTLQLMLKTNGGVEIEVTSAG